MKPLREQEAALEKRLTSRALRKHDGCVARAARELNLSRRQFDRLVARHGLQDLVKRHQGAPPERGNAEWRALGAV